jgi:hypothetical protein
LADDWCWLMIVGAADRLQRGGHDDHPQPLWKGTRSCSLLVQHVAGPRRPLEGEWRPCRPPAFPTGARQPSQPAPASLPNRCLPANRRPPWQRRCCVHFRWSLRNADAVYLVISPPWPCALVNDCVCDLNDRTEV